MSARPELPRWARIGLIAELALPSLLLFGFTRDALALAVPVAGPWAAWRFGHSCGLDQAMPLPSWGLLLFGIVVWVLFLRRRSLIRLLPVALVWWPAWLYAAILSAINAQE